MAYHQDTPQTKLVIIEGNIGAGKSTLLNLVKSKLDIGIIPEPTEKWQQVNKNDNLLDLLYKNPSRWAYTFQSYAFLTRVNAIYDYMAKNRVAVHLLERSVYCDRFCFAKQLHESGNISAIEWQIYQDWFTWLVENFTPRPSGFIYLRTSPHVAHQRILKRKRHEESGISLEYLESLHNKHDEWLLDKQEGLESLKNIPVLVLDCDHDFEMNPQLLNKMVDQITEYISSLTPATLPITLQKGISANP